MFILFKSPTGNSGQMLNLYHGQLIINFIEVAIKEREKRVDHMQNSRLSLVKSGGEEMASPLDSVQNSEKRT